VSDFFTMRPLSDAELASVTTPRLIREWFAGRVMHAMLSDPEFAHLPLVSYVEPDLSIVSVEYA
jgi:hypothetical protein